MPLWLVLQQPICPGHCASAFGAEMPSYPSANLPPSKQDWAPPCLYLYPLDAQSSLPQQFPFPDPIFYLLIQGRPSMVMGHPETNPGHSPQWVPCPLKPHLPSASSLVSQCSASFTVLETTTLVFYLFLAKASISDDVQDSSDHACRLFFQPARSRSSLKKTKKQT